MYRGRGDDQRRLTKSLLAISHVTAGPIRVVIVRYYDGGWAAYFSADPPMSVQEIFETLV